MCAVLVTHDLNKYRWLDLFENVHVFLDKIVENTQDHLLIPNGVARAHLANGRVEGVQKHVEVRLFDLGYLEVEVVFFVIGYLREQFSRLQKLFLIFAFIVPQQGYLRVITHFL